MTRILMVCHGHPDFSIGGGEIAAYRQCRALRDAGHEVLFLARSAQLSTHCGTPFSQASAHPHDVLFHPPDIDHFLHSQRAKWAVYKQFRSLLDRFRPEVIHFHHYVHLGVELLREARKYAPTAPIVLTLHEYLAICHNHGQMVKSSGRLCERAGPADCSACFPQHSPQDFFLRESYIRSFLDLADAYVCPSRFLLERYAHWGLPREKLYLIENGQPEGVPTPSEAASDLSHRFALLGQVSELKGALVFLDAVSVLPERLRSRMVFEIYGTLQHQGEAFRTAFDKRIGKLEDRVRFYGDYRPDDLHALMARVGWVVVPSIWWENSPMVIQEAFNHRRPVICSNIGGMAEKVTHGRDGLHFIAGSAADLASRMEQALTEGLWARLQAGITTPMSIKQTIEAHLELYARIAATLSASVVAPLPVVAPLRADAPRSRRATLVEARRALQ
jgi:glycosyltransferase involved in cell wall biosynthesis